MQHTKQGSRGMTGRVVSLTIGLSLLFICIYFVNQSLVAQASAPNIAAEYGFNEGAGLTTADTSGNSNTGTIAGAAWTAGKYGNALQFNGSNSYVNLLKTDAFDTYATGTIEFWVKQTSGTNYQTIFNSDSGACKNPFEFAYRNGNFEIWSSTSGCSGAFNLTVPIANQTLWHHIAYVVSTTGNSVYVDGIKQTPTYIKGTAATVFFFKNAAGNKTLYNIGRSINDNSETFNGVIDELRIYNRPLSQAEIQADMNTPINPSTPDTTAPAVSFTAPTNGATIFGTTTVSASASDNIGVVGVQFVLDGINLNAEDTVSPYSIAWNTRTISDGNHDLVAIARDAAGNTATSSLITVTVKNNDTVPPTISMIAPIDGTTASGTIAVAASASDDTAVAGVQFFLDGVNLGTEDTSFPFQINWDTRTASNTSHILTARARDAAGNTATATPVNVTFQIHLNSLLLNQRMVLLLLQQH
jgi:hypothetical protein